MNGRPLGLCKGDSGKSPEPRRVKPAPPQAAGTAPARPHRSTSQQQVARRLIKPEEVLQGLCYDEQIVLIQNAPLLRCGRVINFRRPEMVAKVKGHATGSRP